MISVSWACAAQANAINKKPDAMRHGISSMVFMNFPLEDLGAWLYLSYFLPGSRYNNGAHGITAKAAPAAPLNAN